MYLPARIRAFPLKSLYIGVALAMISTLTISFAIFHGINTRVERKTIDPVIDRIDELELESARAALGSGGKQALATYLSRLNHVFRGASHYLLDAHGIDQVTGEDRRFHAAAAAALQVAHPLERPLHSRSSLGRRPVLDCRRGHSGNRADLDLPAVLPAGAGRHGDAVLDCRRRRGLADSQDRRHHRAVRQGQSLRTRG